MFSAVSRGNVSSEPQRRLILRASMWDTEKRNHVTRCLLHAVGKSWRRRSACSCSRSCNLFLHRSILPKASVSRICQFKFGTCGLVYKWSLWERRKVGFQPVQECQPYLFGRPASLYWLGKKPSSPRCPLLGPSPSLFRMLVILNMPSSLTFAWMSRFFWNNVQIVVLLRGCRNTMWLQWLYYWGKVIRHHAIHIFSLCFV